MDLFATLERTPATLSRVLATLAPDVWRIRFRSLRIRGALLAPGGPRARGIRLAHRQARGRGRPVPARLRWREDRGGAAIPRAARGPGHRRVRGGARAESRHAARPFAR